MALGILSWLLFVHLVIWQVVNDAPPDWWFGVALVGVVALFFTLSSLLWVMRSERFPERRARPTEAHQTPGRDALGRPVRIDPEVNSSSPEIEISTDATGEKRYEAGE